MKKTLFKKAHDTNVNSHLSHSMNYANGATCVNNTASTIGANKKINSVMNSEKNLEAIENDNEIQNRSNRANSFSCKFKIILILKWFS